MKVYYIFLRKISHVNHFKDCVFQTPVLQTKISGLQCNTNMY